MGEARDATDLGLPGVQQELIDAVAATGTPTVVIVISGRVHTLGDVERAAAAVLWSLPPGEEGGNGIDHELATEPGQFTFGVGPSSDPAMLTTSCSRR